MKNGLWPCSAVWIRRGGGVGWRGHAGLGFAVTRVTVNLSPATRVYVYVCALVSDPAEVEVLLNKREEDGFGVSSRGRQAGKAF